MNWLTPLGLLGLIGIAVLILIYILKPNYQQKVVSSTYVWKLSLKYRRKKIPINRLRNILLFLCQVLIIIACALILAQPMLREEDTRIFNEKIVVLENSGNMQAASAGETRFERAVSQIRALTGSTLTEESGAITVIIADESPYFLVQRQRGSQGRQEVYAALDTLLSPETRSDVYGTADIDRAMALAENVLAENPESEVILYTATKYQYSGKVNVQNVAAEGEWNAAVIDGSAEINPDTGYYDFSVEVACFGRNTDLMVYLEIYEANGVPGSMVKLQSPVRCENNETVAYTFNTADDSEFIFSYDHIHFCLKEDDALPVDNDFYIYGGIRPKVRVQYASSAPNTYFNGFLMTLRDRWTQLWDIDFYEVPRNMAPETEGYDVYIFEHRMPEVLPTDGIVILSDPDRVPQGLDIELGARERGQFSLVVGEQHAVTQNVKVENIALTEYTRIVYYDNFIPLMYCGGDPALLVRDTPDSKIVILPYSVNYSNDVIDLYAFPMLMLNIFKYYLPAAFGSPVYEVDDVVQFQARGTELTVTDQNGERPQNEGEENTYRVKRPGTYTVVQKLLSQADLIENFYVKLSAYESNTVREAETFTMPYFEDTKGENDYDLLIYLASALVALLFLEWWLQMRENF